MCRVPGREPPAQWRTHSKARDAGLVLHLSLRATLPNAQGDPAAGHVGSAPRPDKTSWFLQGSQERAGPLKRSSRASLLSRLLAFEQLGDGHDLMGAGWGSLASLHR